VPAELVVLEETVPGGWYWSARLMRGETLRIVNDGATSGVSGAVSGMPTTPANATTPPTR